MRVFFGHFNEIVPVRKVSPDFGPHLVNGHGIAKLRCIFIWALSLGFLSCLGNLAVPNPPVSGKGRIAALRQLSDYCPSLKNTPGDTAVYVLNSGEPGANLLLAAGTHGNETAGIHAAEFFVELARVEKGCVFVIPRLNNPGVASGSRLVPVDYQGQSDPEQYTPPEGITIYAGMEQRNIDRSYPGTKHAGLAQKIALAVMNLLITENIEIAIDMHEAKPGSDLAWCIVSNPKNVSLAALAVLDLEEKGIRMHLDASPPNMDGLSHREWGNRTRAMAFLIETVNPAQADTPLPDEINNPQYTLSRRSAIHLETVRSLVSRCNEALSMPLVYSGIPDYSQ